MRFIIITQYNAWCHDASINCDFDTPQNKIKNIFTNNFTIFSQVHIFSTWGKMPLNYIYINVGT
jgi:hypothetical protein